MSCQQFIQEDPYIFTDTLSNSTSCNQPILNSQTKYVPINRQQTIYNRQFRQHEPTIALSENGPIDGHSKKLNDKIAVNLSSKPLHEKRNGDTSNSFVLVNSSKKSPRTSPKFFSNSFTSPQNQHKLMTTSKSTTTTTNHSTTVSKKFSTLSSQSNNKVSTNTRKLNETQSDHGATTCDNATGREVNTMNGKIQSNLHKRKFSSNTKDSQKKPVRTSTFTDSLTANTRVVVQSIPTINLSQNIVIQSVKCNEALKENQSLTRDARLNQRKLQLRRQMYQLKGIQHSRAIERSKMRFRRAVKLLKKFELKRKEIFTKEIKKCQFVNCLKETVMLSSHCFEHILEADKEQQLIKQCSFLYSHGEQCRMPVLDVMSTIVVCREHQNAPSHQLLDTTKPKKATFVAKKRYVVNEKLMKKSGKKIPTGRPAKLVIHPNDIQKKHTNNQRPNNTQQQPKVVENVTSSLVNHQFIHQNSGNLLASSQSSLSTFCSTPNTSDNLYLNKDLMTMCENNYESSEDTGVGGLSENELMPHEIIGTLDMEGTDELAKFCNDILTEPLQATRDDEEYLDRAIEEASSVGIDQISFDHFDGLDVLEMMDDFEQRQMISAATNLISMSNMQTFINNHDQDYTAMPSPMMS